MVAKKAVLEKIKAGMNLNIYEAKIYTSLLSRGISSAGELADISGVPRSRCYDVLESLEKKGFVMMKIGKPIKYIAIAPEEVLETLKKNAKKEERRLVDLFDSIKDTKVFSELQNLYSTGINYISSDDISTSIVGRTNINLYLKDMLARASKKVTIHTTKDGVKRKMKVLKKALPKSVEAVIHAPVEKVKIALKNVSVNNADTKLRFVKIDDEILLFTSHEEADPDNEAAVWLKSNFVIDALSKFLR